jgi:hypothetical protein
MTSTRLIVALLALALTPASAQMRGASHIAFGGGYASARRYRPYWGSYYYGDPFLYDDYPSGSLASAPAPPQVVVVQASSPVQEVERSADPLLIELRGNEYVRVGDGVSRGSAQADPISIAASPPLDHQPAADVPAVLIYRDGRHEQVADYAIVGGIIYARGDYWRTGSWTKPIQLSALNIPATILANQKQGVKFVLPAGPNEVVTRP